MISGLKDDDAENEAIEACKRGESDAFEYIVEKYKRLAYYVALRMVGNLEDAMDLSQEAFVKAYRAISTFKTGAVFKVWFYQILRNTCISHLRKRKSRRYEDQNTISADIVDVNANPEKSAVKAELKEAIMKAMDRLTPKRREVLMMREFDGLSYKEISKVLGITIEQVKNRLHYARKSLINELEPYLK